jgi:hypothetical protein
MDKLTKEIEEMAEKVEKASVDPKEKLFSIIKALGPKGLKDKLPTLSDDDKKVLKAALEEMTLKKAVSFDKEIDAAKVIHGKESDTILQEEIASDDADEKLMKPEAAHHNHQGNPIDGWQGQVVKSDDKGKTMEKADIESNLDLIIEKAMEKCKDDKMVMKKLKEKGMEEGKVQGALERYKAKKQAPKKESEEMEKAKKMEKEDAKKKLMAMEEKEHGTKDPKKLVAAEKKEHMEKAKMNKEEDQLGDAPEMKEKPMGKKGSAPDIEDNAKANKKNMTKSLVWEDPNALLKANTGGRNFNFNVEAFVNETLAKGEPTEELKKAQPKEDINDLIAKSMDKNWDEVNHARRMQENAAKQNGKLVKSFEDNDIATILGLSEEEAKKILG